MKKRLLLILTLAAFVQSSSHAAHLKAGDSAPPVKLQTHEGKDFDLNSRKGQWTVLFFYPKADTPGCTKQACTYRDSIAQIRKLNAEVYGISADTVEAQSKFHEKHRLTFTLLADPKAEAIEAYGTKMPLMKLSKRWTFIIDPDLVVRSIDQGVDPVLDAANVAKKIAEMRK